MTNATMQYYDPIIGKLKHPQASKIRRLIKTERLQKIDTDHWRCLPTLGYNTTTYNLFRDQYGGFKCSCQGFSKRESCSHSVALNRVLLKDHMDQKQGTLL